MAATGLQQTPAFEAEVPSTSSYRGPDCHRSDCHRYGSGPHNSNKRQFRASNYHGNKIKQEMPNISPVLAHPHATIYRGCEPHFPYGVFWAPAQPLRSDLDELRMRMHHKYNLPDLIHANGSRRSKVLIACRHCRRRKIRCQQQPGKACQNCERGKLQCIIERVQRAHTSRMSAHVEETNPENGNGYSARPPELMSPSGSRGQPPGVDSLLGVPVVGDASGLVRTSILTSGCEVMATSVSTEHRLQDLCVPLKETGRLIQTKWTSLGHDNTHMWNRGLDSSVPFVKDGIPPNPGKPTLQDFPQNGTPQAIRKYDLPQIAYQGSQMLFQELGVERSKISHFAACADHNYPDVIYPPSATTLSNSSAGSGRSHIPNNDSLPSLKVAFKDFIPK